MVRNNPRLLSVGAVIGFVLAGEAAFAREIPGIRAVGSVIAVPESESYATGRALLALNDLPGALAQFRQALTSAPDAVDTLNAVAVTYDRLGRPDIARTYYEAGLAIDPASASLNNNFGYSLYLQGDHDAAAAALRIAAASDDAAIAATALRNLALIASAESARPAFDPVAPPGQHIERTSDGEQRLVYAADASTGDVAALTSVATPWTERDDDILLASVAASELAERDAAAALGDAAVRVTPAAPVMLAIAPLADEPAAAPAAAGWTDIPLASLQRFATSRPALYQSPAQFQSKRGDRIAAATGVSPIGPQRARFDSDDPELNAFAARLQSQLERRT